jgi:PleD family two-component response regulator
MQHEGAIRVDSKLGLGTVMTLYLRTLNHPRETHQEAEVQPETQRPCGDGQLALVVEDSAATRGATVETLRSLNYNVIEARAALVELQARPGEIAVMLTDAVMPKMGG